jgi:hypothetical protein
MTMTDDTTNQRTCSRSFTRYTPLRLVSYSTRHRLFSSFSSSSNNIMSEFSTQVHGLFHKGTSTMTYIISDPSSSESIVLDSVLDYDAASGRTSHTHNRSVVEYCTSNNLNVKYILESHVHGMVCVMYDIAFVSLHVIWNTNTCFSRNICILTHISGSSHGCKISQGAVSFRKDGHWCECHHCAKDIQQIV